MSQREEHFLRLLKNASHSKYHIEYGEYLSSHFQPGLVAFYRLGASAEKLSAYFEFYEHHTLFGNKLEAPRAWTPVSAYQPLIGKRENYEGLVQHFLNLLTSADRDAIVRKVLLDTIEGVHAAALHPIIQLGYALEIENVDAIASGLAYMVYGYRSLCGGVSISYGPTDPGKEVKPSDFLNMFRSVREEKKFMRDGRFLIDEYFSLERYSWEALKVGIFQRRMLVVGNEPELSSLVDKYTNGAFGALLAYCRRRFLNDELSEDIVTYLSKLTFETASRVYGQCAVDDFFLLHGVTSAWSLTKCLESRISSAKAHYSPCRVQWMSESWNGGV